MSVEGKDRNQDWQAELGAPETDEAAKHGDCRTCERGGKRAARTNLQISPDHSRHGGDVASELRAHNQTLPTSKSSLARAAAEGRADFHGLLRQRRLAKPDKSPMVLMAFDI